MLELHEQVPQYLKDLGWKEATALIVKMLQEHPVRCVFRPMHVTHQAASAIAEPPPGFPESFLGAEAPYGAPFLSFRSIVKLIALSSLMWSWLQAALRDVGRTVTRRRPAPQTESAERAIRLRSATPQTEFAERATGLRGSSCFRCRLELRLLR